MKNIILALSFVGILLNSVSAASLYQLTSDPNDAITLNQPAPPEPQFTTLELAKEYLHAQALGGPITNLGEVFMINDWEISNYTDASAADVAGIQYYNLVEDQSVSPSVFKLDPVVEGDQHQGAPLVLNVKAEQRSGTKYVDIEAYVVLATETPYSYTDKTAQVEFWFKSDPDAFQWERCVSLKANVDGSAASYQTEGAVQSGRFSALWDAGTDKPSFKTSTGKIRVLVSYDRTDEFGNPISGSGWDGFEPEKGPTFTASGDAPVNLEVPMDIFNSFLLANSISRIGSYDYVANSALFPVYDITNTQFMQIFTTSTPPDSGKYAVGVVFDTGGAASGSMSLKLTPVH